LIHFEKVTFYCKHPDKDGEMHMFPVDSLGNHETAKKWATVDKWDWDRENKKRN